ncbi:MAG TPA: flavin reductase family protein [Blastocatellia bacterium]|nr:flavin reductase family protein [Blastocatellia bacterium]
MPISKDEFRSAMSRFASGVTVVTAKTEDGQPSGLTVSSFASLSLEPPLVLICIDKRASIHDLLVEGRHFAVNVLGEEQEILSRRFASRDADRFSGTGYADGVTGMPLLNDVLVAIECRIVHTYPGGDHTIVVGEVEHAAVSDGKPLAYFRGGYAQLA